MAHHFGASAFRTLAAYSASFDATDIGANKGLPRRARLAAFTASLLVGISPLSAQVTAPAAASASAVTPAPAGGSTDAGDIIVTAQRREQRLQDVPVSVSVVSGQSLQQSNITSLENMAERLPNVKIAQGTQSSSLVIRGVGSGPNAGYEQSVATFVDGVYRSRSRSTEAALFDVERVEVLKGPQTTFFGANAIAGALSIVTRKPTDHFDYNGSAYYVPSTHEYDGQVGFDVPLSGTLSARLAGRLSGTDGYVHNDVRDEDGPHNRTEQGRLSLHWEPSGSYRSDLRVEGSHVHERDTQSYQLVSCPPASVFTLAPTDTCGRYLAQNGGKVDDKLDYHTANPPSDLKYDYIETGWTNSIDVGSGSINSITGYFWHDQKLASQGIPFPLTDAVAGSVAFPTYQGERYRQFSQELRYQSATGGTFEYMLGAYASWGKLDYDVLVGFRFLPFGAFNPSSTTNATTPVSGYDPVSQDDRTLSTFASATIRPIDHLRVNLGARFSSIHKEAHRYQTLGTADASVSPGSFVEFDPVTRATYAAILGTSLSDFANPHRTDNKFMPSVNVQYDITPGVMAYISYANGFKAGGYGGGSLPDQFGPETVNAYEAGLKGQFFDRRLTADVAIFRSDYRNLQETSLVLFPSGVISSLVQNVAQSRAQGVEFNGTLRLAPWLTFDTSLAYLDSKYTKYPNGACTIYALYQNASCVQDLSGKRRTYAPKWSGNIGARITAPVGASYRVSMAPLLYFTSKFFESATADPLLQQKGYAKLDLRIGFGPNDRRWEVALIGKNLTDKTTSQFRQTVPAATGSVSALVDAPRTVGVQVTFRR